MPIETELDTASEPLHGTSPLIGPTAAQGGAYSPYLWWPFVVLAYTLATVVMTWPYAAHLADSLPPQWDPPLQVWVLRWVQHALATDPRHLYDANIFYPLDNTLAYTDSNVPAALLGAPLFILTGNAILTYNILLLGTFVLAGAGMCALLTHLSGNRAVGFLAGLAYAFLPYRYDHIWHLNQLSHAWTPWAVLALLLLVKRQTWGLAVACGAVAAIQVVSSFYVGFQLAVALGLLLPAALLAERRALTLRLLSRLLLAGVVFAAITLPLAWPYLLVRDEQGLVRGLDEATYAGAMPGSYLKVPMHNRVWGWLNDEHILAGEDTLFPGGLAVLGALGGVWVGLRRRRALTVALLAMAAVAFVISLGPVWNARGGGTTPLPYTFLFNHFPLFGAMRVPARFGALVDFAVVTLGGLGAGWAWERFEPRLRAAWSGPVGPAITAAVALLLLVELGAVPVRVEPAQPAPEAAALDAWLAGQPDDGAVLHLPQSPTNQFANARYQVESTRHWHPLVYGYSGFIPARQQELIAAFTGDLARTDGSLAERVNFVSADNVGILQDLGVRYLVVHREGYTDEDWSAVLAHLAAASGALEAVDGFGDDLRLYRVLSSAAPPVTLDLAVPTAAAHGIYWEPTLLINNPSGRAALTSRELFRPVTLTVRWRDASGREVRREERPLTLPLVVPAGESVIHLQPDQPELPGRYAVQLDLTGGLDIRRALDVTVYDGPPEGDTGAPPLALAEVAGVRESLGPGETLALALTWEALHRPADNYTLFAQLIGPDGKVWGQQDGPAGWTGHGTATWLPGERVRLPWSVPLQPDAPPGTYRLLVGMYRQSPGGVERVPLCYPDGDATEYWAGEITVP